MRLKQGNKNANSTAVNASRGGGNSNDNDLNGNSSCSGGGDDDLDMESGDDEIDVGTNADSMLLNYANSDSLSPGTTAAMAGMHNDHQFGANGSDAGFALPKQSMGATGDQADRKRAHHNALERKRRDHIKDSFHTLRDAIPNIKGEKAGVFISKTSRAQILKAATDYIKIMRTRNSECQHDIDSLKKQNNDIEIQIKQLENAKKAHVQYVKQQHQTSGFDDMQIKSESSSASK